jgi:hypothetical protein
MAQKMLFYIINISAEILLHILGYILCAECHILACVCQMLLPLKEPKFIYAKAALLSSVG